MAEHPILFSAPMVRAILADLKTQTRRVVKPQPDFETARAALGGDTSDAVPGVSPACFGSCVGLQQGRGFGYVLPNIRSPYGVPGDLLWVRETWAWVPRTAYRMSTGVVQTDDPTDPDMCAVYRAGWERCAPGRWRPSIHMPRWASRLTLRVTDVRVERVQEITETDAVAEGIQANPDAPASLTDRSAFAKLWDALNAKRGHGWDLNPYVWVVSFERTEAPR